MAVGAEMEPLVENLMNMGFTREQVIPALRAAFFNPDRAAEYLLTGIPAHLQNIGNQAPAPQQQAPPAQAGGNNQEGGVEANIDPTALNELQALI